MFNNDKEMENRRKPSMAAHKPKRLKKSTASIKKYRKYSKKEIERALDEYNTTTSSIKDMTMKYNISKSVLARHLNYFMKEPGGQRSLTDNVENQILEHVNGFCAEWGTHLKTYDLRLFIKAYLDKLGLKIPRFRNNLPGCDFICNFFERHRGKFLYFPEKGKRPKARQLTYDVLEQYFSNINCANETILDENLWGMENIQPVCPDGDSKVPEIQGQFQRHGAVQQCSICRQKMDNSLEDMKNHLEEYHPTLMISVLGNKSAMYDGEETADTVNEEMFTEFTELEEKQQSRKKPILDQTSTVPPQEVKTGPSQQEINSFLTYIGSLLRNLPKKMFIKLQLDVIGLILNAEMPTSPNSMVTSKEPV